MPSKKGKWSKTYDKHKRNRDVSAKESEESSEQNQQERKDKGSPGNEGSKGACGTPADEKPDGSHRQDKKSHSGRKQGEDKKGRTQGKREIISDPGGNQGKTQNRSSSGSQRGGSGATVEPHPKTPGGNQGKTQNRPSAGSGATVEPHPKNGNFNKQKKQADRGRGRGASRDPEKDQVASSNGRGKPPDSRNQEQRPGRPNPMNRNPQQSTRPPARGVSRAKPTPLPLKTLKEKDSTEVVQKLNERMAQLKFLLRSQEEQHNSDEFIYDLTCTLAKACRAPSGENTNKILVALKGSVFLNKKIPSLLDRVQASTTFNDQVSRQRLIQCLIEVFTKYLTHLPSSYVDLPYVQLKAALHQSSIDRKEELQKELDAFKQARDDIIKGERQKHGKRYINKVGEKPPNDFRDIPICPTNKEITTQERPFLRKNISKGRYENAEHYLDVQYRLLREDFLEPLREGIHEIVLNVPRHRRKQLMKNYRSVRIVSKQFTKSGIIHRVQIDVSGLDTSRWAHSKRLIYGSFVCLSKDNFKTMLFATVSDREPEKVKKGRIDIRFIEEQDVLGIESRDHVYQMVESPAYFEAYRHVLKGLKELDETTMPFKKYLVECSEDVDPPEYLRRSDAEEPVRYNLNKALDVPGASNATAVPVLQPEAWPSVKTLPLNDSQLEALKTAITTEFSVIQGPPGTGKTYVGAKIVRCLLENRRAWDPQSISPMLMVCYTNHALDQFLEKVLEFLPSRKIIRVGGRCKSENLEACNVKKFTYRYRLHEKRNEVEDKMRQSDKEMTKWKGELAKADHQLLEFKDVEELLLPSHLQQLCNATFPCNVANESRTPENTFKLWLCNNKLVGSCNQTAEVSIHEKRDANEDDGFLYEASLFTAPKDGDENKPFTCGTRDPFSAVDVLNEISKTRLEQPLVVLEQKELKKNSYEDTLPRDLSAKESSTSLKDQPSSKASRGSVELNCTAWGNVELTEVAESIQGTENPQAENKLGGEKVDDVSEANEETIAIERKADLIQNQKWIQGDEDLQLPISEQTGDLVKQEQEQGWRDEENDDGFTLVINTKKGKSHIWMKADSKNSKKDDKGAGVGEAENEVKTAKTIHEKRDANEDYGFCYEASLFTAPKDGDENKAFTCVTRDPFSAVDVLNEVSKTRLEQPVVVLEQKELKENSYEGTLLSDLSAKESGTSLKDQPSSKASRDGDELNCTVWKNMELTEVAESIQGTENPQEENKLDGEKVDDVSEANEETIAIEREADLIQNQRWIQGDEDLLLPISEQTGDFVNQEQEQARRNEENDDGFTFEISTKQDESHIWMKADSNNFKKDDKGVRVEEAGDISSLWEEIKKKEMMSTQEAMGVENIWNLSYSDRHRLYLFWIENYRERYRVDILRGEQEYERLSKELEAVRFEEEEQVIRQATVVGMTTSGAARYHSMLQRISPKIVVIEEAAEVMEAHIITSLSHTTKHTILIGDHKQLRPKPTVYELAQKYNLEVSLFERMVMNSMDCKRLSIQHRMRPEIAALTKRIYDHEIIDHESVCHFEDISGLCQNLFFVDHCQPENKIGGLQSYSNHHEAEFLVALCKYLLLQGYDRNQITILTMYTGQLLLLQEKMPRRAFEGVKVCAVDNFQGEENDIILLSMVRSNSEGRIGFLGESNRICVAFSRARQGFYCIGNFNLLKSQSKLLKEICDDLKTKEAIGDSLQLVCKRHSNVTNVRWASDFRHNQLGGCTIPCGVRLDCGHACDMPCHASDVYHKAGHCPKLCVNYCPNNHKCPRRCHYPNNCSECNVPVLKTPRCGHEQLVGCSIDPDVSCRFKCEKMVTKTLACGHEKRMPCYTDPLFYRCTSNCTKVLECGHPCSERCYQKCRCNTRIQIQLPCKHWIRVLCREKDKSITCKETCERVLDCGHNCPGMCHEDCKIKQCKILLSKELPCGHQNIVACFQDPKTAFCPAPCPRQLDCGHKCSSLCGHLCQEVQCEELCQRKCEGGHPCQKRCHFGSSCDDCKVEVNMTIPTCGHSIITFCYVDPATLRCKQPCERLRVCGHPCDEICSKNCETWPCQVSVSRKLSCDHVVTLACHKNPEKFICKKRVQVLLPCKHKTSLECHIEKGGLEHVLCKENVEKNLRCNHKLTLPCHKNPEDCICRKKVDVELPCGHTKSIQCSTVTAGLLNVCCTVKVSQTLPCNHEAILPCYIKPEEYCCQEEVEITLSCGHSKRSTCSNKRDVLKGGMCITKVTRKLPCGHEKEVQCSDKPDQIFCDALCERFLSCEHPCPNKCGDDCASVKCAVGVKKALSCGYHKVSCLCSEDVSQFICSHQCTQKLTCGHQCPGKCSELCSQYQCKKMVVKNLNCAGNHSRKMHCKDDPNSIACQERCNQSLDCGHPCPGFCSQPCARMKCKRGVEKRYPCGHKEHLQCFQSKTATCKAPCRRRERCKHMCKGICGEPCSKYPCDVVLGKTLPCGHKVKMPCSFSVYDALCPAPCGAKLSCSHQCSGTCGECKKRGSHEMCQNPCNRLLICSHRCEATCSKPCPPCIRKCGGRCPHGRCTKKCLQNCNSCRRPCTWVCPHYQCKNLCGEECDRPRCDAPCPKKLACRHPCIGLCGENCPTVCAICHAKKLSSMVGDKSDKTREVTRYLQLFDCGHIVKVDEMDAWMLRERGSDVQLIQCPRCSTPITFSYRYGNIIKRTLTNIKNVKAQICELGNEKANYSSNLLKKLRHPSKGILAVVEKLSRRPRSMSLDNVHMHQIPFVFTLGNNLLVKHQIEEAQHILEIVAKCQENSKQQLQITEHFRMINDALENISEYLKNLQLDLTTLNQVYEHTRKFNLFASILEAQCEAVKRQSCFSSIGETRLKMAEKEFNLFVEGNNDALRLDWLEKIVASLRKEVDLTPIPPEAPKDFENFPGFNRGVWKLCEHRQVYFTRSILRDGEHVSVVSNECRQCVNTEEGDNDSEGEADGWRIIHGLKFLHDVFLRPGV